MTAISTDYELWGQLRIETGEYLYRHGLDDKMQHSMTSYSSQLSMEHKARVARLWAPKRRIPAPEPRPDPVVQVRRRSSYPHYGYNSEILSLAEFRVSLHEILAAISAVTGVNTADLVSHKRETPICQARMIYYRLARLLTDKSLPQIGYYCGDRDHSTVMNGLRLVERKPEQFAPAIAAVRKALGVSDG